MDLFGKLQIEILRDTLAERFGVKAEFSGMKTICRGKACLSCLCGNTNGRKRNLHRAGIGIRMEPLEAGEGNRYETQVSLWLYREIISECGKRGVWKALEEGLEYAVADTRIVFVDADYDSVTSTPADYRRLAPLVVRKALQQAGVISWSRL